MATPALGKEIEVDAAMDAAFAEMAVVSRGDQLMAIQRLLEAPQIIAETGRRNRAILRAGPGARIAGNQRAGAESRFAQAPHRKLFAAIKQDRTADAGGIARGFLHHAIGALANFVFIRTAEFDDQKGAAAGQHPHGARGPWPGKFRQTIVEAFERFRAMAQQPRHLIGGD